MGCGRRGQALMIACTTFTTCELGALFGGRFALHVWCDGWGVHGGAANDVLCGWGGYWLWPVIALISGIGCEEKCSWWELDVVSPWAAQCACVGGVGAGFAFCDVSRCSAGILDPPVFFFVLLCGEGA